MKLTEAPEWLRRNREVKVSFQTLLRESLRGELRVMLMGRQRGRQVRKQDLDEWIERKYKAA